MTNDLEFMSRALRLAEKGRYSTHPNPAVGCVIVRQGKVVGEGYHVKAGEGHAEANALAQAGDLAEGADVYVTLEPCSFEGRTPSCAKTLVSKGVSKVVIATLDPDPRNAGNGVAILQAAGIKVEVGVLESSAKEVIQGHCKRYENGVPFIRLKLAMSLDGKTALSNGESQWITSAESRADVQRLRARSAAIVTGVETVIADDPQLNVRADQLNIEHVNESVSLARPVYILDSKGRTPTTAQLLNRPETVIVTAEKRMPDVAQEVLTFAGGDGRVDLHAFIEELARREHSEVLFECGATLSGALIEQKLVDELVLYVAPSFMGGDARSLLNLSKIDRMADLVSLTIKDMVKVGPDIRITARLSA